MRGLSKSRAFEVAELIQLIRIIQIMQLTQDKWAFLLKLQNNSKEITQLMQGGSPKLKPKASKRLSQILRGEEKQNLNLNPRLMNFFLWKQADDRGAETKGPRCWRAWELAREQQHATLQTRWPHLSVCGLRPFTFVRCRFDSSTIELIALQLRYVCDREETWYSMSGNMRQSDEVTASACGWFARVCSPLWSAGSTPRLIHKSWTSRSVWLVRGNRRCARERGRATISVLAWAWAWECARWGAAWDSNREIARDRRAQRTESMSGWSHARDSGMRDRKPENGVNVTCCVSEWMWRDRMGWMRLKELPVEWQTVRVGVVGCESSTERGCIARCVWLNDCCGRRLFDWLAGWLMDWLPHSLTGWLIDWFDMRLADVKWLSGATAGVAASGATLGDLTTQGRFCDVRVVW